MMHRPVRLQSAKPETRVERVNRIVNTDTEILAVQPVHALVSQHPFPMDKQGRRFLRVINPYEHTFDLVEAAVERFYEVQHFYPAEIVLSVGRFLSFGWHFKYFYPKRVGAIPIPYTCERSFVYDVIVRGEPHATLR